MLRAKHLGQHEWWIELIRTGAPWERGRGYGTLALREVVRFMIGFLGARQIGVLPHPLGHSRDLTAWYKREGFTHQIGQELWLIAAVGEPVDRAPDE